MSEGYDAVLQDLFEMCIRIADRTDHVYWTQAKSRKQLELFRVVPASVAAKAMERNAERYQSEYIRRLAEGRMDPDDGKKMKEWAQCDMRDAYAYSKQDPSSDVVILHKYLTVEESRMYPLMPGLPLLPPFDQSQT